MFDDTIEIFAQSMSDLAGQMGEMIMGMLPYAIMLVGAIIAINLAFNLIETLILDKPINAAFLQVKVDDGIPDAPDGWVGDEADWHDRWVRKRNDELFNESYRKHKDDLDNDELYPGR
jgi:hypothetical protein